MNVSGNNYGVTNNNRYNRYSAFTKHSEDKTATSDDSRKLEEGVVYDKGSESNSKIYTWSGTLKGTSTSTGKTKYSGQKILDEINKYISEGKFYAIFSNGKETWMQGIEPGRNGGPVGSKKYFDPKELEAALGKTSVNAKFSSGEVRSRLAQAGIEDGFFTVTIGGRETTHFLSQGKNSLAVYSKEQYDERYQAIKNGTMFKRYAGSTVSIGGKEYAVGEDGKVDIEYGEDVFDIFAKAR